MFKSVLLQAMTVVMTLGVLGFGVPGSLKAFGPLAPTLAQAKAVTLVVADPSDLLRGRAGDVLPQLVEAAFG